MILTELLSSTYDLKYENWKTRFAAFRFDAKKIPISVNVTVEYFDNDMTKVINLDFSNDDPGSHPYNLSKQGDAFKILATVQKIALKTIEHYHASAILFFGDTRTKKSNESSRVTLYRKLALSNAAKLNWHLYETEFPNTKVFIVAESRELADKIVEWNRWPAIK